MADVTESGTRGHFRISMNSDHLISGRRWRLVDGVGHESTIFRRNFEISFLILDFQCFKIRDSLMIKDLMGFFHLSTKNCPSLGNFCLLFGNCCEGFGAWEASLGIKQKESN